MQLVKYKGGLDWFVVSDCGRIYDLALTTTLKTNETHDIVIIFDFNAGNEEDKSTSIVDFFYGADDFIENPDDALDYIKRAIIKYEKSNGYIKSNSSVEVIKEF